MTRKVWDDSLGFGGGWNNTWGEVEEMMQISRRVSTKEDGCGDYGLVGPHG